MGTAVVWRDVRDELKLTTSPATLVESCTEYAAAYLRSVGQLPFSPNCYMPLFPVRGTYGDLARLGSLWIALIVVEALLFFVAYMFSEPTNSGEPSPWRSRLVFALMGILPLGLGAVTIVSIREWRRSRKTGPRDGSISRPAV